MMRVFRAHLSATSVRKFSSQLGKTNALLLGPPGGGKGTIAGKLMRDFRFEHISTGDILRKHIRDGTELGKKVSGIMESGGLVPDEDVIELVLESTKGMSENLLLDGFPRTARQAELLHSSPVNVDAVIMLDVPHSVIVKRIAQRWVHAPSGRTYSYDYNPPKVEGVDDLTGEALVQRADDTPQAVTERLNKYQEMIDPLLKFYDNLGVLKVFAGTESNKIYPDVKEYCVNGLNIPLHAD